MTAPTVLIDACVLYPTVMREVVLRCAGAGLFKPLWSARILEEWARAAAKLGPEGVLQARAEIALVSEHWPGAEVAEAPEVLTARLWLPDRNDIHVLAAAVHGGAGFLMTLNTKDFPARIMAEEGISRVDPDQFLLRLFQDHPEPVRHAATEVLAEAQRLSGTDWGMRPLLKKARLPRLGKALST